LGEGAQRDGVAIVEKSACLSGGQCQRLGACAHLDQTTFRTGIGTGDGSRREQVAGAEIASVAGVVGQELRWTPIEIT